MESRGESKVADFFVFSHMRMMVRLGQLRDNDCPAGLEPLEGLEIGEKLL